MCCSSRDEINSAKSSRRFTSSIARAVSSSIPAFSKALKKSLIRFGNKEGVGKSGSGIAAVSAAAKFSSGSSKIASACLFPIINLRPLRWTRKFGQVAK